ncbi:MAG: N-acetyl sugar amidotransferase [Bacteroidota bacterium]
MIVAIIDFDHFQYALTISELFNGYEKLFIVSNEIHKSMIVYSPELTDGEFIIIEETDLGNNISTISKILNDKKVDIISINPIFKCFKEFYKLINSLKGEILFTVHNLNFWFRPKFRTPWTYYERIIKKKILKKVTYIAVEDFLFQYITNENPDFLKGYNFVYIPFTLFSEIKTSLPAKSNNRLKVVLPGAIDKFRRQYDDVLEVVNRFAAINTPITFSFPGPVFEEYGQMVISRLAMANKINPGIAIFFNEKPTTEQFKYEMQTADIILSTSIRYFDGFGTREYIGKTKPTAAIHDMMSFELPGILPAHLNIPENLKSSAINYIGSDDLFEHLNGLINDGKKLEMLKSAAKINSRKFSAEKIRVNLPFLNLKDDVNSTKTTSYRECKKCLLNSDDVASIYIHYDGSCNYCQEYEKVNKGYSSKLKDENFLNNLIEKIKTSSKSKKYDCIMGLSGGVDSSYALLKIIDLGLKPLVVHYDNGWNSEFAIKNIESLVQKLNLDLYTYVNDWEEFREMQRSFIMASVIDIELISDMGIMAVLYKLARKHNIKYVITGHNDKTESHLPMSWYHWKRDWLNIRSIHYSYSRKKIKSFPHFNFKQNVLIDKYKTIETILILNYLDYDKTIAQKELVNRVGWNKYEGKHFESVFTRFYQGYVLPIKFGVDKRKSHYSSLICAGMLTRDEAVKLMNENYYSPEMIAIDKDYVIKKLNFTESEFDRIMKLPVRSHFEFASYLTRHYKVLSFITSFFKRKK